MRSEIYTDAAGHWRWRLVNESGETVGGSAEGFASYADCLGTLDQVKAWGANSRQRVASALPTDPRTLIGMFNEATAENIALMKIADRLFGRD